MSKSNALETSWLALLFNATAIANIADNAASSPATNLYFSLHTADPGEAGNQTTSEMSYTSYARVAVARTSGGWTVASGQVTNAATITFPKCTGVADSQTALYWGIGLASSGSGTLEYSGPLGTLLGIGTGKASNDTVTIPGLSGLSVNDKMAVIAVPNATVPAGVTEGTTYFAKTVSTNDVTLSATSGGALLDITADRSEEHTSELQSQR